MDSFDRRGADPRPRRLPVRIVDFKSVEQMGDRNFVARANLRFVDEHAVDANAMAAAEIANDQPIVGESEAAMSARDLRKIKSDVAIGMLTDENDGTL